MICLPLNECIAAIAFLVAFALALDEIYDGRTNPEHGLKRSDIGKRSHESGIIILMLFGIVLLVLPHVGL